MNLQVFGQEISKTAGSPPTAVNLCLVSTYLSRNFATLGPMIRQPPCDLMCWKVIHGWRLERKDNNSREYENTALLIEKCRIHL